MWLWSVWNVYSLNEDLMHMKMEMIISRLLKHFKGLKINK